MARSERLSRADRGWLFLATATDRRYVSKKNLGSSFSRPSLEGRHALVTIGTCGGGPRCAQEHCAVVCSVAAKPISCIKPSTAIFTSQYLQNCSSK